MNLENPIMKRLFVSYFFISFFFTANGQITRGNWLVGGNANFSSSKQNLTNSTDKNSSTLFSILPNIGYFVADKFAFGISTGVSFTQSKSNNTKSNVTSYKFGPFAKYYFLEPNNTTNLFIQGAFGYGINRFNNFGNSITTAKNISYQVAGGPVIYFNNSVGLEFILGWNFEKAIEDKSNVSSLILGIGFQIHLEK
ncbi:MAG: hypothetical protein CUR34_01915 [Sediminibacterium sp.]|nr:MAG: hypothetical protein CUR34_01915 [Sediminibacterium sp.] [Sediminibacterium sp. FEMGT703S]